MNSFWEKFYGPKDPYSPGKPFKYYPAILTIAWWRWCLAHPKLAPERIRLHYIRYIKRQLKRPWCWITNHQPYDSSSWGYTSTVCSRCNKVLTYKRHS